MAVRKQLEITKLPENYIPMLKIIRTIGNMGLREAKDIYKYMSANLPCVLVAGVEEGPITDLAAKIEACGGACRVSDSDLSHPTVLWPAANAVFEWHWFFGPREKNL